MGNKDEEKRRTRKRRIIYSLTLPRQPQDQFCHIWTRWSILERLAPKLLISFVLVLHRTPNAHFCHAMCLGGSIRGDEGK